jgi:CHRD domain-containing protein
MEAIVARNPGWLLAVTLASCTLAFGACKNNDLMPAKSALCTPTPNDTRCGTHPDGGASTALVAYSCPKGSRPDQDPVYDHGVPEGLVCSDIGPMGGDGSQTWCCTQQATTCAFNPVSTCPITTYSMDVTSLQVTPSNDSPGTGAMRVTFDRRANIVSVAGAFSGLTSPATAAHVHGPAAMGATGDILITLTVPAATSGGVAGSQMLSPEIIAQMIAEQSYLDIHTDAHPDGEVRAQITPSTYGFQCRGGNRPEAMNPLVDCGNGVREDDLINYCCTGRPVPLPPLGAGCVQSDGQCTGKLASWLPDRMSGWTCTDGTIPAAEDFKANESRADFFYFLCATPTQAPNPRVQYYCCYVPALVQPGGSCVVHMSVPGCGSNRFGFACYGRDTPEQDFIVMTCDDNPTQGLSAEGYPAKLYCCDIKEAGQ